MIIDKEIINTVLITISSISACLNVYFFQKNNNISKKLDTKHFWYRNYILNNQLNNYNKFFEEILKSYKDKTLTDVNKILIFKENFEKLREFFYKTRFFDKNLYNSLNNFINLCEEECINFVFSKADKSEEILVMRDIILKSLYEYELNNYENFTIKLID